MATILLIYYWITGELKESRFTYPEQFAHGFDLPPQSNYGYIMLNEENEHRIREKVRSELVMCIDKKITEIENARWESMASNPHDIVPDDYIY